MLFVASMLFSAVAVGLCGGVGVSLTDSWAKYVPEFNRQDEELYIKLWGQTLKRFGRRLVLHVPQVF